jgi:hypothetical protein
MYSTHPLNHGNLVLFRSAVVAMRPQMPIRLGERHGERFIPHVLRSRYECSIRMLGWHQFEFDVLLENQSSRYSFISLVWLIFLLAIQNCLSKRLSPCFFGFVSQFKKFFSATINGHPPSIVGNYEQCYAGELTSFEFFKVSGSPRDTPI